MSSQQFDITCPKCNATFPLTETLAKPLLDAERLGAQQRASQQSAALQKREQELATREKTINELQQQLDHRQMEIEDAVQERLRMEREAVVKATERSVSDAFATKFQVMQQELAEKDAKLAKSEEAELAARKERRVFEEEKRKLELEIERRLHDERLKIREATQKEEHESYKLKLAEKDKLLAEMKTQVEELRRKGDQGSQQLQGEVQELELESLLRSAFPLDQVEAVQNGRSGGDIVQKIMTPNGHCGTIVWESKRTKTWSNEWLSKNREDQRSAGGQIGVIVSSVLPKGTDNFDRLEGGVWVTSMRCALPLAKALRQGLIEVAIAKVVTEGRDAKADRMYDYLTGPQFTARVSSMVEGCVALQEDFEAEKRAAAKYWARRERHLELLMTGTAGMYGDLQGIVGKSMPELHGLTTGE